MKRTSMAAAALLLSTTAFAAIPSTAPTDMWVEKDPYAITATSAVDNAYAGGAAPLHNASYQSWSADDWTAAEPVAYVADDSALKQAADGEAKADVTDKADAMAMAEADTADVVDEADNLDVAVEPAAMDAEPVPVENAAMTGLGGPYEAVNPTAADLTPRPAAENYPACRPGPGDDRCIQLYEPGVRQQLAAWSQPTGGFAGADTQVAMGGPYEPADAADESAGQIAMNGDGSVETTMGETVDDEELAGI